MTSPPSPAVSAVLAGCYLCHLERAVVEYLLARDALTCRRTILTALGQLLDKPVSDGFLNHRLDRLTEVGILESRRGRNGGYQVAPKFRQWLALEAGTASVAG
jgi:hypothetical protein